MTLKSVCPATMVAVCGLAATTAQAQNFEWAAAVSGDWDLPANWTPLGPPLVPTQSATIGFTDPFTVRIDVVDPHIDDLSITNASALVDLRQNTTLAVAGLNNEGTIRLNIDNSALDSVLSFPAPLAITGGGEIQLLAGSNNSRLESDFAVTNGASHLIRGLGESRVPWTNLGEIRADQGVALSGTDLLLTQDDITNDGTLSAVASSTLSVNGITIDQSGGGEIVADEGDVNLNTASVIGGTFNGINGGVVHSNTGVSVCDGATNVGSLEIDPNSTLALTGDGLTNNGVLRLNTQNSGLDAVLQINESVTLDGSGEVQFVTGGNNSRIEAITGTLTHGSDHLIRGAGEINAPVVNQGEIRADGSVTVFSNELELQTNDKTNLGIMSAAANSFLDINGITIDQTSQGSPGMLVANDGTIRTSTATILGGSIEGAGTGSFSTQAGTTTLMDVVLNLPSFLNANQTISVTGAGLVNNDLMLVNNQNSGLDSVLLFTDSGTLGGSGEVRLRTISDNSRIETAIDQTITHAATHTISGAGQINASMLNEGTIVADAALTLSGDAIILQTNNKQNVSTIAAAANSFIDIVEITLDQTDQGGGAGMLIADGGTVRTTNATIVNGSIESTGAGSLSTTSGTTTLHDVTLNAPSFLNANTTISVTGAGLVNNDLMLVNNQNSGLDSVLLFTDSGTLGGSGEVRLRTVDTNSRIETADGQTVTNASTHTISGAGQIGASMINEGAIIADESIALSGSRIILNGNDKTNNGIIRAAAGSSIDISDITIDQTGEGAGGMLVADETGAIVTTSATILGGEIAGDGALSTGSATTTLGGVVLNADSFFNANDTLAILGPTLSNNGLMVGNPQNSGADSVLFFDESCTLDGTGEINLATIGANTRIEGDKGVLLTNGADHTIGGIGEINVDLSNAGTIAPGDGLTGGATAELFANAEVTFEASGALQVQIDATGADRLTVNGPVNLGGTVEVELLNGFEPSPCDTFVIVSGTSLNGEFDDLVAPDAGPLLRFRLFQTATTVELRATCLADVNADCQLNILDFVTFQGLFQQQASEADCNDDGLFNILDFICFQGQFVGPCN